MTTAAHVFRRRASFAHLRERGILWFFRTITYLVLLCGAGAVRGGGVSGVPGHNAAMAVLEQLGD